MMLRIMIVNFQGIWSKKEFFENCLLNSNADVVIGSETFLNPSIKNVEFLPPGFTAYRRDRDDRWGGVTKSSLDTDVVFNSTQTEYISIKKTHQKPVILCSAYRPRKNDIEYLKLLVKSKESFLKIISGLVVNLPDINWENNIISSHQELNESFLSVLYDGNLSKTVNFPTRKDNTRDILSTTNNTLTSNIIDVPGISNHQDPSC